ncbi:MAG: replication initiation protein [Candidimonas sp.]|nr:replication initiation protein [Candidimonas sp.]
MSALLRTRIESTVARRPWCGAHKNFAIVRPLATALKLPYVQLNPPAHACWLQFDIDRPEAAYAWEDADLPPPTYVSINRENTHAQYGYALAAPVCTTAAARTAPVRYLAAIERAYNKKMRADLAFNGPLAKNPLHESWLLWQPANDAIYELGELADYVDLPTPAEMIAAKINVDYSGLGRNCFLFEQLRAISYSEVRKFWRPGGNEPFFSHLLNIAEAINSSFTAPLGFSEVKAIVKSVSKWTWKTFSPAKFRDIQAARGRLVGATKRDQLLEKVLYLSARGESNRAIARALGVDDKTVAAWLRRSSVCG